MKKAILFTFLGIFALTVIIQWGFLGGFNVNELGSINTNIMVSSLSILATVFIVDTLIKKFNSKARMAEYLRTLKKTHLSLVNRLTIRFISIVTKEPTARELTEVLEDIEKYIDKDFLSKPIKVMYPNPNDLFNPIFKNIDYFTRCYAFKNDLKEEITTYLNRYASILPSEVTTRLLSIDELLKDNLFTVPMEYGITLDTPLESIRFDPKEYIDLYTELGNEILALKEIALDKQNLFLGASKTNSTLGLSHLLSNFNSKVKMKWNKLRKNGTKFIGISNDILSYADYQQKSSRGDFIALEDDFIEKLTKLSEIEKRQLKHALTHSIHTTASNISLWLSVALPIFIVLITLSLTSTITLVVNSKIRELMVWLDIGISFFVLLILLIVGIAFIKQSRKDRFLNFYYEILLKHEKVIGKLAKRSP